MIFIESRPNLCGTSDWDNKLEYEVKGLNQASLYTNEKCGDVVKSRENEETNILFKISNVNFVLSVGRLVCRRKSLRTSGLPMTATVLRAEIGQSLCIGMNEWVILKRALSQLCVRVCMDSCVSRQSAQAGYYADHLTVILLLWCCKTTRIKHLKKFSVCVSQILTIIFACCDIFCSQLFWLMLCSSLLKSPASY